MQSLSKYALPALLAACLLFSGCYQAQVTTNKSPGNTVVEKNWAPSFLYGLVPASVDVSDECSNGIASAQRKLSFLNMVVSGLTFNLFTPQSVTVTCAAGGSMSQALPMKEPEFTIREGASSQEVRTTLSSAALESVASQKSVTVQVVPE